MRRTALLATSLLFFTSAGWSGVQQTDASENLCRADPIASSLPRPAAELAEQPIRERVFGAPLRGALTKSIIDAATELLDYPMGSEFIIELNGIAYGFRLEPHYHPPGYEGGPIGWHKGVTVYEIEERDAP